MYQFHIPDGQAIVDLVSRHFVVWLISGRDSPCIRVRARALGAKAALGVKEKHRWLKEQEWFNPASSLIVSDNNVDAILLCAVREAGGIAIATADAEPMALAEAECVTKATGGNGVVAESARALLSARGFIE